MLPWLVKVEESALQRVDGTFVDPIRHFGGAIAAFIRRHHLSR